ncbi:MAG: hypothetical protein CML86_06300 [Rhodobiaceae bacterium]|nr:hypothetical protein [Rhodobiaceae bacterium]|tara:strand:+ start:1239 stop:1742 length:504 start_codon:yes stop_codon:yes gene_type:complete
MAFSKARRLANLMSAGSNEIPAAKRTLATDSITKPMLNDNIVDIARLDVSDGSNGQFLRTNGSGTLSFASVAAADGRAYTDWAIKTGTYTAVDKDQLIANSGSDFTITLPASPSAGATVVVKNVGAGTVTIARNGSNIEGSAQDGTLESTKGMQVVYVGSTPGWKEL